MKRVATACGGAQLPGQNAQRLVAIALAAAALAIAPTAAEAASPQTGRWWMPGPALAAPRAAAGADHSSPASAVHSAHFDLLLIGDSITHGTKPDPGFRDDLLDRLNAEPLYSFTLVGSTGTVPLRGHFEGGKQVQEFYPAGYGHGWGTGSFDVTADLGPPGTPGIVAIHVGTNDLNSQSPPFGPYSRDHGRTLNRSHAAELAELLAFLLQWQDGAKSDKLRHIVLSTIIPIQNRESDVRAWNNAVIAIAEDLAEGTMTGRPVRVTLADHHRRFQTNPRLFSSGPGDWMRDGLHPNRAGEAQMADVYHRAILASIEDHVPPAAVRSLEVTGVDSTSVTLSFLASGDDLLLGRAWGYDVRWSTEPFDAQSFGLATQATGEPDPGPSLTAERLVVTGLRPNMTYHFALKVVDDAGNRSPMSSLVSATTAGTPWSAGTVLRTGR